ncbi:MAG: hypothetical protein JF887_14665 [Candidatus Dormibacteraeota bacterium]|uniref:Gfo/Idh/MocA-like oxidoreductase C-terminal domain-containing protein n=1 Tax=Candidatus Amunia macphersoniae TaxID=3127014 RepID=A0A934KN05_9BACT|nr:hypothetical protein [Candidatus Dormibacteraeota bacterium]
MASLRLALIGYGLRDARSTGGCSRARWGRLMRGDDVESVPSEPGRWNHFYPAVERALRLGEPPPVGGGDAVAALEVLDALRSSKSAI